MAEWCSKKVKVVLLLPLIGLIYLGIWYMNDSTSSSHQDKNYDFHLVFKNSSSLKYPISTHNYSLSSPTYFIPYSHNLSTSASSILCHEQDEPATSKDSSENNGVLIIGATSFIGASIARILYQSETSVVATEDYVNIGFDPMAWYRWEQLTGMDMSPQYVNYSKMDIIKSLLKKHSPKSIIYIPTVLYDKRFLKEFVEQITTSNKNFLRILQAVHDVSPSTNIILMSVRNPKSSYSSLIKLFELSLSVYNRLHHTNMAVIQTDGIYGPWQSGTSIENVFVNDLVTNMNNKLLVNKTTQPCNVVNNMSEFIENASPRNVSKTITNTWIKEYELLIKKRNKGVIASTYITAKRNAQYAITFNNNNYYFMENWFKNIYKMNLNMAVFNDDLSSTFVSTFKANYPNSDFVRISDFKGQSPNDRRFAAYYDYIIKHPEISYFVMTDMRDVIIQNDPFEILEVLGDYFYIGIDEPFKHMPKLSYLPNLFSKCFPRGKLYYQKELNELGFFNAGVIGGNRYMILAFLTKFQQYFDISSKQNCNMAVVEYLAHKDFYKHLVYGWPFNAGFLTHQPQIPGLAVLHKWTMSSYN